MKVLAVSDVVNKRLYSSQVKRLAGNVDLILSCGDLPAYYLDFLVSALGKPLFFVCGNHDSYCKKKKNLRIDLQVSKSFYNSYFDYDKPSNFGGVNLDKKIKVFDSALFAGLEGSYWYNGEGPQYTERQMRRRSRKFKFKFFKNRLKFGRSLDVLMTHAPPFGIHDKEDRPHRGFETFIDLMDKYKPKYLLHGHIHLYDSRAERITDYQGTKVINCYDYQILDLDIGEESHATRIQG